MNSLYKNPRSLIVTIQGLIPSLSAAERAIAEAILTFQHTSPDQLRMANIAAKAKVSEAAIVKFAKRLGLDGFRELRAIFIEYSKSASVDLHEELSLNDDSQTIVRKIFSTAIQSLNDTLTVFDFDSFEAVAQAVASAPTRLLFGVGGSATIARDFEHKLLRIGVISRAHDDTHLMAMSAALVKEGDVVLGISHSGTTRAVIEAIEIANERGATAVALTNTPKSPLTKVCRYALVSAAQGSPIIGENAASRIAQLNILDALFVRVAQYYREQAVQNLGATMGSVTRKRFV